MSAYMNTSLSWLLLINRKFSISNRVWPLYSISSATSLPSQQPQYCSFTHTHTLRGLVFFNTMQTELLRSWLRLCWIYRSLESVRFLNTIHLSNPLLREGELGINLIPKQMERGTIQNGLSKACVWEIKKERGGERVKYLVPDGRVFIQKFTAKQDPTVCNGFYQLKELLIPDP